MMTQEERKKLIEWLRESAPDWTVSGHKVHQVCDELEQLARRVNELESNGQWGIPHYSWPKDANVTGWFRWNERFRDD